VAWFKESEKANKKICINQKKCDPGV